MPDVTAWVIGIPSDPQKPVFKSKEGPQLGWLRAVAVKWPKAKSLSKKGGGGYLEKCRLTFEGEYTGRWGSGETEVRGL